VGRQTATTLLAELPAVDRLPAASGVPEGVVFRTKPELAVAMLTRAVREGAPFRWVGGASVSGDSPTFVRGGGH
jgi:SRSO17 transposase